MTFREYAPRLPEETAAERKRSRTYARITFGKTQPIDADKADRICYGIVHCELYIGQQTTDQTTQLRRSTRDPEEKTNRVRDGRRLAQRSARDGANTPRACYALKS